MEDVKSPSTSSAAVAPASLYVTPKSTVTILSPISFITGKTSTTLTVLVTVLALLPCVLVTL